MLINRQPTVKFLLVDDLEENLLALELVLKRKGLELLKARSGAEALEHLLVHDVALALIDVQMPVMDGFELAELMRGIERTRRVPIIFVTAGADSPQRRFQGYEAGAVDFLIKPIEPHILKSKAEVFYDLWLERQEVARQRDELSAATEENGRLLEESRHLAEVLKEADRRKDEFLATLAHELRNPLAPLGNGLKLLEAAGTDLEAIKKAREMMQRQVEHLVRLVDDLLDMSRVTSGKIQLRREIIDLRSAIEVAIEIAGPAIEKQDHQLVLQMPAGPIWVNGDTTRLAQIVGNLLTNAARYTPAGGQIELDIIAKKDEAQIEVRDNGIGIPAPMLDKVFGLFTQVQHALPQSQGGLGIGLALVKKLVELHEGEVTAESKGENLGSIFRVKFPCCEAVIGKEPRDEAQMNQEVGGRRILIADDNADSAESLAMLLGFDGHVTRVAYNGNDAVAACAEFKPDIAFLDIGMPGMNGFEVAQVLRSDDAYGKPVLVALTGWGSDDHRQRSKDAGFDFHLVKPIQNSQLEHVLAQIQVQV